MVRFVAKSFSPVTRTNLTSGLTRSATWRMASGFPFMVTTTISFVEKTTYQEAAPLPEPAIFLFIRSSSTAAGDDGANTSQVSPFRMRSASCRETPEVRFIVTSCFFLRKPS